jgi:hypothetical protein
MVSEPEERGEEREKREERSERREESREQRERRTERCVPLERARDDLGHESKRFGVDTLHCVMLLVC